jgi:hypothetical protein
MKRALLLFLLAGIAVGEESSGILVGLIVTSSGDPFRNERITLVDRQGVNREATTDELGTFAFNRLGAGQYRIEPEHGRLTSPTGDKIVLGAGEKRSWRLLWSGSSAR